MEWDGTNRRWSQHTGAHTLLLVLRGPGRGCGCGLWYHLLLRSSHRAQVCGSASGNTGSQWVRTGGGSDPVPSQWLHISMETGGCHDGECLARKDSVSYLMGACEWSPLRPLHREEPGGVLKGCSRTLRQSSCLASGHLSSRGTAGKKLCSSQHICF